MAPPKSLQRRGSDEDLHRYRTDFPSVGRCLIINNENFHLETGYSTRRGSEKDSAALKKTFENLGYQVTEHKDLTKKQMKEELKKVSEEDHSENASFVCVILSHGDEGGIFGTDNIVALESLFRYFTRDECETLVGKPKLFFIHCTGGKIPEEGDFLCAYAATPAHYAFINTTTGSWFIQSLCEMLEKHTDLELNQIMTRVNRKVSEFKPSTSIPHFNSMKQFPCIVSTLTKEFYFQK